MAGHFSGLFNSPISRFQTVDAADVIQTPAKSEMSEVKKRSPNQGLGSIPASKKWGSGSDPRVQKIMLWDLYLRLLVL